MKGLSQFPSLATVLFLGVSLYQTHAPGFCGGAIAGDDLPGLATGETPSKPLGFEDAQQVVYGFNLAEANMVLIPHPPSKSLAPIIHLYTLTPDQKGQLAFMAIRRGDTEMTLKLPELGLSAEKLEQIYRSLVNDSGLEATFKIHLDHPEHYDPYGALGSVLAELAPQLGEERTRSLLWLYLDRLAMDFGRLKYPLYPPAFLNALSSPEQRSRFLVDYIAACISRSWPGDSAMVLYRHPYDWQNWGTPFTSEEARQIAKKVREKLSLEGPAYAALTARLLADASFADSP